MALQIPVYTLHGSDHLGFPGFYMWHDGPPSDPDFRRLTTILYDEDVAELIYWLEGVAQYYAQPYGNGRRWLFLESPAVVAAGRNVDNDLETYIRLEARAAAVDRFYPEQFIQGMRVPILTKRTRQSKAELAARDELKEKLVANVVEYKCEHCPSEDELKRAEAAARANKRSARDGVFAAYRLKGLTDADLLEVLGDFDLPEPPATTAEAEPQPVPSIPATAEPVKIDGHITYWSNYAAYLTPQGKNDPNCLLNELIERYSVKAPKNRSVAEKSIRKLFRSGDKGTEDTSIKALVAFCERYHIPLRLYNAISKTPIVELKGSQDTKRQGIAILCWNEHAYVFTGANVRDSEPKLIWNPPGAIDVSYSTRATLDEEAKAIYDKILSTVRPNFFYVAERHITVKSLFGSDPLPEEETKYITIDMSKCFYTSLFAAPGDEEIGVFTACDSYEGFTPDCRIEKHSYYFVSQEEKKRWASAAGGLLKYRCNNMLTGYELEWLARRDLIKLEAVKWVKRPQYTTPVEDFRQRLQKCSEGASEALRQNYGRTLNGLLGIKEATPRRLVLGTGDMDASLLEATHPGITVTRGEEACIVKLESGYRRYLYLSNRHLYNYVVARANIAAMECAEALRPLVGSPVRCRTDGFTYELPEGKRLSEFEAAVKRLPYEFRIEEKAKPPDGLKPHGQYIDVEETKGYIDKEIKEWFELHKGYVGPPGTGKTTLVKTQHSGEYKYALSLTNMCARQLTDNGVEGKTLHSGLRLFAPDCLHEVCESMKGQPIWIDEISMVNSWIWSVIFVVGQRTPIIFSGDPRQCSPIGKTAKGAIGCDPLNWKGPLLSYVVNNCKALMKDYRNDEGLIAFREAICNDERPDKYMYKLLALSPNMDGSKCPSDTLDIPFHIVWGNDYRVKLNSAIVAKRGLKWEKKELKKPSVEAEKNEKGKAYTFEASKGLRLLARIGRKGLFGKGSFYELLESVSHDSKVAKLVELRAGSWEPVGSPIEIAAGALMNFALGYAVTAPSSQGMTVEGGCALHQLGAMLHKGEHRELAYTAVTRLRTLSSLSIVVGQIKLDAAPESQTEVWNLKDDEDLSTGLTVSKR